MSKDKPVFYSPELAKEICDTVAKNGYGLKTLCRQNPHWPHRDTIYEWLHTHPNFSDMYARAKKAQVLALVDDILEISDDSTHDDRETEDGNYICNSEWINRSRLRVDTRKWIAAKLVPRLYGDNMAARELSDEIEELKEEFKKGIKNGKQMDSESD